jgi:hypothetical protein
VYRQKAGTRELGCASLTGARLSQSREGERAVFTVVDVGGTQFTFASTNSQELAGWVDACARAGALSTTSSGASSQQAVVAAATSKSPNALNVGGRCGWLVIAVWLGSTGSSHAVTRLKISTPTSSTGDGAQSQLVAVDRPPSANISTSAWSTRIRRSIVGPET